MNVEMTYDSEADVLYASLGKPTQCTSREVGPCVLLRYDVMHGALCAVTLIGARQHALADRSSIDASIATVPAALSRAVSTWLDQVSADRT